MIGVSALASSYVMATPKRRASRGCILWAGYFGSLNISALFKDFEAFVGTNRVYVGRTDAPQKAKTRGETNPASPCLDQPERLATNMCAVMDISQRGAKIVPDGSCALPTRFELAFVQDGQQRKVCEVIWRRGRMIGVKFVG